MFQQDPISLISVLILAVLPSLVWLFFYLKEDPHPEPRYWLFIIFLIGVALAPLVISLEMVLSRILNFFATIPLESGLLIFIIAPLVEEVAKYGVVHLALNKNPVLDEPVDGMIYVIVAALGFAAIENVFAIFSFVPIGAPGYFNVAFNFISMRFISAVALHGLASGISGYYFAKFYFPPKADPPLADIKRNPFFIIWGLFLATFLHGVYNFLIVKNNEYIPLILTGVILGAAAVLVIFLFNRLKHYKTYQQAIVDEAR
ncbi:MAG: PrsW family glutamic-type intramembrane protease [Candidatus Azambacteria bacterium]|nr:PrsW family glutamic-type intramembrane protease [Candidatus Azambacteria bacterium]